MSDHIEVLEKMYSASLVESTDRSLTSAERQEAAAQYRALREAIDSLRQVPEVVDWRDLYRHQTAMRYMDSDSKITTQKADAMAFEDIARIERHHAASKPVDRMAAMIEHGMSGIDWTPEKATPAQAGAELPELPAAVDYGFLVEAAKDVCWFDWQENDDYAVAAIQHLRDCLDQLDGVAQAGASESPERLDHHWSRHAFEAWFADIWAGSDGAPVPEWQGQGWDAYIEKHQLAFGAWDAAIATYRRAANE